MGVIIKKIASRTMNQILSKSFLDNLIHEIGQTGFVVRDNFMDMETISELTREAQDIYKNGHMHKAKTGINHVNAHSDDIRGDFTFWLDSNNASPAQTRYLSMMEELRISLNEAFFLGLFEFESHFAYYPAGTFYKKHLDQIQGKLERQISCVLYLNEQWHSNEGGELRLYIEDNTYRDITPVQNRIVIFISEKFLHEVMPGERERMSLTGWFRRRTV